MFRVGFLVYVALCVVMMVTSLVTGRRATVASGHPHYLYTRTVVLVEREDPSDSETDAELDSLFAEAGEDTRMTVAKPMFVLGLLDATLPVMLAGGLLMGGWAVVRRLRRVGHQP